MEKETAVNHPTIETALAAYEQARLDGLCHDGAWECALETVHSLPPDSPNFRRQMVALLRHQFQSE